VKRKEIKLRISRETIVALDRGDLVGVQGADPEKAGDQDSVGCWFSYSCPSCFC